MFLAARGGAGGRGNHFFASDLEPAPKIAEIGAKGEKIVYAIELTSMAHFGLVSKFFTSIVGLYNIHSNWVLCSFCVIRILRFYLILVSIDISFEILLHTYSNFIDKISSVSKTSNENFVHDLNFNECRRYSDMQGFGKIGIVKPLLLISLLFSF